MKYIKATGTATLIDDPEEMQKAFGLLTQKFPFFENLPGEPSDFVGIKVELKEVLATDNTIAFAHTETASYKDIKGRVQRMLLICCGSVRTILLTDL
ncbi:MAG: hypothetical protein HKO68_01625 [Desulfobacterales bacterium]|nr:hypothetical protein [Desulfobacterales bacterium]